MLALCLNRCHVTEFLVTCKSSGALVGQPDCTPKAPSAFVESSAASNLKQSHQVCFPDYLVILEKAVQMIPFTCCCDEHTLAHGAKNNGPPTPKILQQEN